MEPSPETEAVRAVRPLHALLHSKKAGWAAVAVLAALAVFAFGPLGVRFFLVPSSSMETTLMPGDMIATVRADALRRGDIVVLRHKGEYLVKRVVGLPGDEVSVADGALFLNGKYASEPYVLEPMHYTIERPVRVPEGRILFLGDNRNHSEDSVPLEKNGAFDFAGTDSVVGRVVFRYYPYDRMGRILSYPLTNTAGE